jgi:hypothetical protein
VLFRSLAPAALAAAIVMVLLLGGCPATKPVSEPAPPVPSAEAPSPPPEAAATAPAQPKTVANAIEGEDMKVLEKTGGDTETFDMSGFEGSWSNGKELFWTNGKVGDKLVIALPVAAAGKYEVQVQLTKSWDYAIVQVSLDGAPQGEPVDLYSPTVKLADTVSFEPLELEAGEHQLAFEVTGKNAAIADDLYFVGLDYVKLAPAG